MTSEILIKAIRCHMYFGPAFWWNGTFSLFQVYSKAVFHARISMHVYSRE